MPEPTPLVVLATPIGNLGDLSPRARQALADAELVLCEDTRQTRRLLAAVGLPTPTLWRCDAHVEEGLATAVVGRLREGRTVVLVSDAGTPAISDPGGHLVQAALRAGLQVVAVPGPSSVAAALSVCGLPGTPFHFLGFPPRKPSARQQFVEEASRLPGTLVLLESGRRLGALVADLARLLPDREAAICRELTKLHEQVIRGPLPTLPTDDWPGEAVVVVGPGAPVAAPAPVEREDGSLKGIADALAARWGIPRRDAYQRLLALERELANPGEG
ncbi:rRNA small subunit methyltransferase 1 [Myxococcota bacterium]|nr:rRNA small subunit methyltransferase 1 [Myxococcota bacterium]